MAPILKKTYSERTLEDFETFKTLADHNHFFYKCMRRGEEFYTKLFENLEYNCLPGGETLFEAGSLFL